MRGNGLATGQPVRELVIGDVEQRFEAREVRLGQGGYVPLYKATEQEVIFKRPTVGSAIQKSAAPHVERGWFWFTHRRGVI